MAAPEAQPLAAPGMTSWDRMAGFINGAKRYGFVSIICYVTNNLLLIGLDALGSPLWLTLLLSPAIVISLAYLLHARITFAAPMNWRSFGKYVLVQLPNLPIAYVLLWALNDRLDVPMHIAAPVVTTLLLAWNAFGSRWAIARR